MDSLRTCYYIENSFLKPLLEDQNVTDISYNGNDIFYMDNIHGRQKSEIKIDFTQAKDFIRQIANLTEKQFSFQNPKLDVSVGRYRINALHYSVARKDNNDALNFSIRIASSKLKITENSGFISDVLVEFFDILLKSRVSIVLGGQTGCGKTEFQKYLLYRMKPNTRVIVVDNVLELDLSNLNPSIDLNIWQSNEEKSDISMQALIKNALRSNPDWLIAAEARGEEMVDVLNSALTGHPIITTIHALNCDSMPMRMTRMVMMGDKKADYEDIFQDISYNLRFYVYLKRKINSEGNVVRYISEISYLDGKEMKPIYKGGKEEKYWRFTRQIEEFLDIEDCSQTFKERFLN